MVAGGRMGGSSTSTVRNRRSTKSQNVYECSDLQGSAERVPATCGCREGEGESPLPELVSAPHVLYRHVVRRQVHAFINFPVEDDAMICEAHC